MLIRTYFLYDHFIFVLNCTYPTHSINMINELINFYPIINNSEYIQQQTFHFQAYFIT